MRHGAHHGFAPWPRVARMPARRAGAAPELNQAMAALRQWQLVGALGTAQTLAWASSYYLPAMLAEPMARDLEVSVTAVFAAFSVAMLVAAAIGPWAGRLIDHWGGRPVLMATNGVFAAGLLALSQAQGPVSLVAAWGLIGVGMGSGLYEAAFATLVRLQGRDARSAITGITLVAGFASTVGWPLSAALEATVGWRGACIAWAALHLLVALPLNRSLPSPGPLPAPGAAPATPAFAPAAPLAHPLRAGLLLSFAFAVTWFVSTAMASHLPRLLQEAGIGLAAAVAVGALIGPAQVAGRLLEFGLLRRLHPLLSSRAAALGHPGGALLLLGLGAPAAMAFAVLHGLGNGIMTIAKGTLPLAIFGPQGYGALQGLLMAPTRVAQAAAPLAFGWCLDRWGLQSLWLSTGLCLAAFAALAVLPRVSGAGRADAAT
jgi:predicted MFS family arabinose efflux permease